VSSLGRLGHSHAPISLEDRPPSPHTHRLKDHINPSPQNTHTPWGANDTLVVWGTRLPFCSLTLRDSRGPTAPAMGCSPVAVTVAGVRVILLNFIVVARLTVVPSLLLGPCGMRVECGGVAGSAQKNDTEFFKRFHWCGGGP
jgi:hypothetical protein